MSSIAEFFRTDSLWNQVKTKIKIDDEEKLSRIQFLKRVGSDNYSTKAYKIYLQEYESKRINTKSSS